MEAQQVIEKIRSDAQAEADKIVKAAEAKAAEEKAKADAELAEYRKQAEALAQKAAEEEKSHILAAARMEAAQERLAEKTKILDSVFEQAQQRLTTLPDDEYRDMMKRLMPQVVETGQEEVLIGKNESRIDQRLLDEVNAGLSGSKKGALKLAAERHHQQGGFILRRGKIKVNLTLPVLLGQARNELVIDLAKMLFS